MMAPTPAIQSTPVVCEHCDNPGNLGRFTVAGDGGELVLCLDRRQCMGRQGLIVLSEPQPEPEPTPPGVPALRLRFRRAQLRRLPTGQIQALSSDGTTVYHVTLNPDSCDCPGFTYRGRCYHTTNARARYGCKAVA